MEDNVCAAVRFRNGVLGVAEASATTFYSPYMYELYGTRGSYLFRIDREEAEIHTAGENLERLKATLPAGTEYRVETVGGRADNASAATLFGARATVRVRVATLPPCAEPLEQWLDGCVKGTPIPFDIDNAVRLARLTEGCCTALEWKRVFKF